MKTRKTIIASTLFIALIALAGASARLANTPQTKHLNLTEMNNPTSGNKPLELFFTFKVKEGKQEQLEKIMEQLLAVTTERDPGTLIFNVYKNSDGTFCMYERYVDEEAFARHKEIAGDTLKAWYEVVEIQKFFVLGAVSEEGSKKFKAAGYEVFAPVSKMER